MTGTFTFNGTRYVPEVGVFEELTANANGTWTRTKAQGERYEYDINGNLAAIVDRQGNQITFDYDPAGAVPVSGLHIYGGGTTPGIIAFDYLLTKITDTLGREINLTYNAEGRLASITDFNGRVVSFGYSAAASGVTVSEMLTSVTWPATPQFPSGLTKSFVYDANRNMTSIADPKGQTFVQNTYDTANRVSQQTLGTGTMSFSYGSGQTTLTDRAGNVTTYTFNASGNPTRIETFTKGLRTGEPASYITQYAYNANMMMTAVTYPKGNGVKYLYDDANTNPRSRGNLLQVRRKADMAVADNDANDIVVNVTYEPQFNLPKTVTDAKGNVTTFTYDYELPPANPQYATKGNLVTITYPTVNSQTPQADFAYDALGQLTENSDPNGLATQYTYNALGQLVQVLADPVVAQARTQITYDSFGNVATVTDPANRTREYDFNALGWLIEERNGLARRTKYTHDANGNVTQVERQANAGATAWQATQFSYDILNHLKTVTDPLSRVTTYNYDNNENLTSVVDANTKTTAYEYDERGLLFRELDAATPAGVTRYDYDLNGQLATLTDAKS